LRQSASFRFHLAMDTLAWASGSLVSCQVVDFRVLRLGVN
jgi:hypothetical protein